MLYTIFILLGRQARKTRKKRKVTYAVEHRLKVYISWKFLISAVTGMAVAGSLFWLECDLAALFGILTFCLNFIPTVGLLLAVLLPLPIILFAPSCEGERVKGVNCEYGYGMEDYQRILAVVIPYCIQLVVANFVEPVVLGKRLNLHPVVILLALVFWYMMWGIAGAFLSVPIMSVIKIFCQNMDNGTARWFGQALEGNVEGGEPSAPDQFDLRDSIGISFGNTRRADLEDTL
jgi:AI-2 transport protein TqsA